MIESKVLEKAIEEIEMKNFGVTEQFLETHEIAYVDNKPKISRIDLDNQIDAYNCWGNSNNSDN